MSIRLSILFNTLNLIKMKAYQILFFAASITYISCNNSTNETAENNTDTTSKATTNTPSEPKKTGSVNDVVSHYLNIKNALIADNGKEAATAANEINVALTNLEESVLTTEEKKIYVDVKEDIKEHAEHIGANSSDITHQREHFDLLSQDMIDLVKATGSSKTLYMDFCPMYNNMKGASWLSETKTINNPYFGSKMSGCGQVKEEIKAKG